MVKAGIVNAQTPQAGELIRILINHPEIELVSLYAPGLSGRSASSVHSGLIGENVGNFTDKLILNDIDLLFIVDNDILTDQQISTINGLSELKVIYMSTRKTPSSLFSGIEGIALGLSEINRKGLVRGATRARLLDPIASTILICLYPLAKYMLLNSQLEIKVSVPKIIFEDIYDSNDIISVVKDLLQHHQASFNGDIIINIHPNLEEDRGLMLETELECNLPLEEIEKIYNSIYDDHNFTFTTISPVTVDEVVGTQKCLISLTKPDPSKLSIRGVSDIRMRGGAGDAVHVMNLLLGLHEKTGLTFKTSKFGIINQ